MKFLTTSVSSCPWLGSDGRHFIRYESTIHLKLSLIMLVAIDKLFFFIIIDDDGGDLDLIIVFDIVRVNQSFEVVPDHVNCNEYTDVYVL